MKYDKMLMLLTLVAAGLAAGCSDDEDPLKDWTGPSKPGTEIKTPAEVGNRVVAHRGGSTEAGTRQFPDNSVAALNYAIGLGCYASECDIYLTKDDDVVVAHASAGCYINNLKPWEHTLAELRAAGTLANGEQLPSLADFIDVVLEAGTTRLWLDVKNITIDGKSTEEGREASARACERACEIIEEMGAQNFCEFIVTGNATKISSSSPVTIWQRSLAAAGAVGSDDDQGFLKRNLREMSFPYVESSDTFTIRATGDWQISDTPDSREWTNAYGWVHVDQLSGKGDPGTYQKVTVTCDQNTSEERNATIYLHGCGEENVAIAIRQDNGIFEWKPFDNGQQFDVSGMLKLNAEAGAKLRIPYIKALGTEKYTVTVTQTGGDGITAASGSYSISTAGNGYIEVPLTGTATKQGIVTFGVKATDEAGTEKDFGSVSTIVRAGFDAQGEELPLLTQNFGKFPWGGDCIGQKAGVTTADKTVANLSLDNETVSVSAGTNASIGGITSTVRNGNAAFYRAIGMEGWTGYLNYMCPGYIQLGAASDNTDGQPGNLISPVLNIPAGYDLLLTCKVAIWAAAPDQGMVGICEKNDGFWISKGTLDKIVASTKSYVSLDIPAYTWVEVTAVIPNPGAKANPAFFISTADSWFSGSSVKAGRWYIDDIKLVY